jgi:uncharacterized protein (TIGR03435 family)
MRHSQQSANRFSLSKTLSLAGALTAGPLVVGILMGILGAPFSWAQPAIPPPTSAPPEFEVASVKPMPPSSPMFPETGGPGTTDPGQITWSGATLKWLLKTAHDVRLYQVSGPAWLDSERYMIVAKVPEGATKEQVNLMWQNLLKNRFGMVVHHESRVFQADEMTLAKGASKLKETDLLDSTARADSPAQTMPGTASKSGPDDLLHRLTTPYWGLADSVGGTRRILGRAQPLGDVANWLSQLLGHPVIDKTGLTGKYDFDVDLDLNQPPAPGDGNGLYAVASALEQGLGLKLVKSTVRLDVIVVDHAERTPVEN